MKVEIWFTQTELVQLALDYVKATWPAKDGMVWRAKSEYTGATVVMEAVEQEKEA